MTNIYLLRHGQASFLSDNYDQLSPLGEQQSEALGKYFAQKNIQPGAVWCGELVRHRQTLDAFVKGFGAALPEAQFDAVFNEHQGTEVYKAYKEELLQAEPELQARLQSHGKHDPEVRKGFLRLFFKSIHAWSQGELVAEGFEQFSQFASRVHKANKLLQEQAQLHQDILVFTSGGTVSMFIGLMLELKPSQVIDLNWQTRNTGITELAYGNKRFFLRGFNQVPHLPDEWISYV
ncbi:histidine phosphatase family protein [Eisenibacter elegans]|jgi:broad specificity phosphatase PhoE|uniref:histidine phosphatase family protein n=1 Tax=Eisenibacter elegans TaxID=997 RepID=UPI00041F89CC|nr:histidine phosphatase family protein [Eisenibacter elegans]